MNSGTNIDEYSEAVVHFKEVDRNRNKPNKEANHAKMHEEPAESGNEIDDEDTSPEEEEEEEEEEGEEEMQEDFPPPDEEIEDVQNGKVPTILSPLPTPRSDFNQVTSFPVFEESIMIDNIEESISQGSGLQKNVDWTGINLIHNFNPLLMQEGNTLGPSTNLDVYMFQGSMPVDSRLPVTSNPMQVLPLATTPLTPGTEGGQFNIFDQANREFDYQSLRISQFNGSGNDDITAIIAAQSAWSVFRCTPSIPSKFCPRTARLNLERLVSCLKSHETWSIWSLAFDETESSFGESLAVSPIEESTRDKLLAITQTILHKALDIHKEQLDVDSPILSSGPLSYNSNYLLLPPARVLEYILKDYANNFEQFFPLTPKGVLDINEVFRGSDAKAASLLVLLMLAQGAMSLSSADGRCFTGGLTEACRISLFDLIEKNIMMSGDNTVQHSALIFTVQAAWSGDKWQMDIAMGQRGMYLAMLRHSGMMGTQSSSVLHVPSNDATGSIWSDWLADECSSR